jgi:hypothetical protein
MTTPSLATPHTAHRHVTGPVQDRVADVDQCAVCRVAYLTPKTARLIWGAP